MGDGRTVRPVVRDGLLVTFAESAATTPNRLVAHALKDGRPAGVHKDDGQLMAFAAAPGGRVVLNQVLVAGEPAALALR
ncbi:hypothetical protein ACIBG6_12280 [Streptomyces sp. NPDC050842]|uniref:hypothetical protein n=1 Tax=Streptomyces sp. NPDC050842 TaxID=3365636 RepID=UPI00378AD781